MLKRHDLVFFSRRSLDSILKSARGVQPDAPGEYWEELFERAGTQIPGIVRRQESAGDDVLDIGLSSPRRVGGVHYRVSATLPRRDIEAVIPPGQAMETAAASPKAANAPAIAGLCRCAQAAGLSVGILGSHALQAVTGLKYVSAPSDFDLIVQGDRCGMVPFAQMIAGVERELGIVADVEARLPFEGGYLDVKLKELLSASRYVMGKNLSDVVLVRRELL